MENGPRSSATSAWNNRLCQDIFASIDNSTRTTLKKMKLENDYCDFKTLKGLCMSPFIHEISNVFQRSMWHTANRSPGLWDNMGHRQFLLTLKWLNRNRLLWSSPRKYCGKSFASKLDEVQMSDKAAYKKKKTSKSGDKMHAITVCRHWNIDNTELWHPV